MLDYFRGFHQDFFHSLDFSAAKDFERFIIDETRDSRVYSLLAQMAPTAWARDMLMELSQEEAEHAERFVQAYYILTSVPYIPSVPEEEVITDYSESIRQRLIVETRDYEKYGEQYLKSKNQFIKELFYKTGMAEARHAMTLPLLL